MHRRLALDSNGHKESAMPVYRVYYLHADGHIYYPPDQLECENDDEATEKARRFFDGKEIQIWQLARLVKKLPRQ